MAKSKKAETNGLTIFAIVAIIGLLAYAMNIGGFGDSVNGFFGKSSTPNEQLNTNDCPSDGTTTFTIYSPDQLASTATDVIAEYYIFDGDTLYKSGVTSSGSASVDVTCGKEYKAIALNSTAGLSGAYATEFVLNAKTAKQTETVQLVQVGGAKILGIENPADPARNANISLTAGTTKNFDLKFAANVTEKGYNRPVIMCQVNITSIKSVSIGSFSDGSSVVPVVALPKRVSATANYQYYAWEYPKMLNPSIGVITASGSITSQSSITPSSTDTMSCKLVDQATWKKSTYKSASMASGFVTGAENTETLADVGGPDSATATIAFNNGGGY